MKLYELSEQYRNLSELYLTDIANPNEPQEIDILKLQLDSITDQLKTKSENIAKLVLNYESDADATDKEIKRLSSRKTTLENRVKYLKDYLLNEMQFAKLDKIQGEILNLSLCKSPKSVVILDKEQVPVIFRRTIPETYEIDKRSIIENFDKTGEIPNGTDVITDKKYLKIK
jgi:hypothetical protein